jgi:hypothetical protein
MNIVKFYVRKALGLPVHYYFKRAPVGLAAGTHLPILLGLARLFLIRNILEFGSGKFSTLSFLDRRYFPEAERVHSFETDYNWKQRVEAQAAGDRRLMIELIDADVPRFAASCDYPTYDLVLVDNGPARAETIAEVAAHRLDWKLVVIHDFEMLPYQRAARAIRKKFCFDAYCPHTAVAWNEEKLGFSPRAIFRRMNRTLAQYAESVEAIDTERWVQIINDTPWRPRTPHTLPD